MVRWINRIVGIPIALNLGNYLGVPVHHTRVLKHAYEYLVAKVRKWLGSWQGKIISRGARTLLINIFTTTIPLYAMQTSLIPTGVLLELEKINHNFLWGSDTGARNYHPISWLVVCQPKNYGGLGFRRLPLLNLVSLARLCWCWFMSPDALWVRLLTAKYDRLDTIRARPTRLTCSHTWKSLLQGYEILRDGLAFPSPPATTPR